MTKIRLVVIAILLCASYSLIVFGQEKRARVPADYEQRTLKEVVATKPEGLGNKEETMMVTPNILPSRVRAEYAATTRPVPSLKKELLRQWARLYAGAPETYTEPYEEEALFLENGVEYWLAVQKKPWRDFKRQFKCGELVDLYVIRMGTTQIGERWEPLLLVENFAKPN